MKLREPVGGLHTCSLSLSETRLQMPKKESTMPLTQRNLKRRDSALDENEAAAGSEPPRKKKRGGGCICGRCGKSSEDPFISCSDGELRGGLLKLKSPTCTTPHTPGYVQLHPDKKLFGSVLRSAQLQPRRVFPRRCPPAFFRGFWVLLPTAVL